MTGPVKNNYQRLDDDVVGGKGRHLVATVDLRVGDLIWSERPLLALQSRDNLLYNQPCRGCKAFVGGPDAYLQRRLDWMLKLQNGPSSDNQDCSDETATASASAASATETDEASSVTTSPPYACFPCRDQCGHVFCSPQCENDTWMAHHAFLCTGDCPTVDHPLVQFKQYATTTNEVLLLVAEWWVAQHTSSIRQNKRVVGCSSHEYTDFMMNPWWDVLSADLLQQPGGFGEVSALHTQLHKVCETAATLLNEALTAKSQTLQKRQDHSALFQQIPTINGLDIARRVGACEQNCVGVLQRSPMCRDVFDVNVRTRNHKALVQCLLDAELLGGACRDDCDEDDDDNEDEEDDDIIPDDDDAAGPDERVIDDAADDGEDEDVLDYSMNEVATCLANLYMNEDYSVREVAVATSKDDEDEIETERREGDDLNVLFPPLDCIAMYATICKMNHSCDPNVIVIYKRQAGWGAEHPLTAFCIALQDIAAGDELTISYVDVDAPLRSRQLALINYGFQCHCKKCVFEQNQSANGIDPGEDELQAEVDDDNDDDQAMPNKLTKPVEESLQPDSLLDAEICLERRLERLDTVANQSKFGILPSHVIDTLASFVLQTSTLICFDERGLESGSVAADLVQQCALGIRQHDFCLCQIVGCDLEATLLDAYAASGNQWPSASHREAYYCGALTACLGYSHECHFVAAKKVLDKALELGLPRECVECFVDFIQLHSYQVLVGPYQVDASM